MEHDDTNKAELNLLHLSHQDCFPVEYSWESTSSSPNFYCQRVKNLPKTGDRKKLQRLVEVTIVLEFRV